MAAPNFVLITELQSLIRRDFPVASEAILDPLNAQPLVDGEWLEFDTNYKLARNPGTPAAVGGTNECANPNVFPVHTERGRYDTQAIKKVNVIMFGMYEAETTIADTTGLVQGDPLTVQDVTISSVSRRALKEKVAAASGVIVVGYVSKTIGTLGAGGKVRFVHFGNQKVF